MGFGNVLWFSCHQHITMETIKISNFQYYNKTPILRRSLQFIALLSKLTDFKLLSANRSYLFSSKQTIITLSKSSKKLLGFNDRNRSINYIFNMSQSSKPLLRTDENCRYIILTCSLNAARGSVIHVFIVYAVYTSGE